MPNVTIKKADKLEALKAMTTAKFQKRYDEFERRRHDIVMALHSDIHSQAQVILSAQVKKIPDGNTYIRTVNAVRVQLHMPRLMLQTTEKRYGSYVYRDFFTHASSTSHRIKYPHITLNKAVVMPVNVDGLSLVDGRLDTQQAAEKYQADVKAFEQEMAAWYDQAERVVMALRTSKQVEYKFPELWTYLPDGVRERIIQGVAISQSEVDKVRDSLKR